MIYRERAAPYVGAVDVESWLNPQASVEERMQGAAPPADLKAGPGEDEAARNRLRDWWENETPIPEYQPDADVLESHRGGVVYPEMRETQDMSERGGEARDIDASNRVLEDFDRETDAGPAEGWMGDVSPGLRAIYEEWLAADPGNWRKMRERQRELLVRDLGGLRKPSVRL